MREIKFRAWGKNHKRWATAEDMLDRVLQKPADLDALIRRAHVPTLHDDRPVNEYYLLRRGHF